MKKLLNPCAGRLKQKGFTLIELLVVIAIIGILAVVILAALSQARKAAADAKRAETTRNVMTAIETYISAEGSYPADAVALVTDGYLSQDPTAQTPQYVSNIIIDVASETYCVLSTDYTAKIGKFAASDSVAGFIEATSTPTGILNCEDL